MLFSPTKWDLIFRFKHPNPEISKKSSTNHPRSATSQVYSYNPWNTWPEISVHPRNLTWKLKISRWKRKVHLETIIFRFHVKFRGCIYWPLRVTTELGWHFHPFFTRVWIHLFGLCRWKVWVRESDSRKPFLSCWSIGKFAQHPPKRTANAPWK